MSNIDNILVLNAVFEASFNSIINTNHINFNKILNNPEFNENHTNKKTNRSYLLIKYCINVKNTHGEYFYKILVNRITSIDLYFIYPKYIKNNKYFLHDFINLIIVYCSDVIFENNDDLYIFEKNPIGLIKAVNSNISDNLVARYNYRTIYRATFKNGCIRHIFKEG
jgi:hypothetical protein